MTTPSPEAIAQSIVDRFCEKSGFHRGQWLADKLIEEISQAIQDARQPVAIDEAEILQFAKSVVERKDWIHNENRRALGEAVMIGFRECARRNAAVVSWPSYEEIDNAREEWAVKMLKSFGETPATINDQKETFGDLAWDEACRWLSRRILEGGK